MNVDITPNRAFQVVDRSKSHCSVIAKVNLDLNTIYDRMEDLFATI